MARILIIDDSMVARMSVKSCIPKDAGHTIREAGDGKTGLAAFDELHPDVTFLDLTMPEMSGLEVLTELRRRDPRAVVIVLTADVQKQTGERVLALGATAMLSKPASRDAVQAQLAAALGGGSHA
jgi:two-component system chemotaxis response regulator CheY